jgi:hypothetical protein
MKTCNLASRLVLVAASFLGFTTTLRAINIAVPAQGGTGIIGVNDLANFTDLGLPLAHGGAATNVNDGVTTTRSDTFGNNANQLSYAGVTWATPRTDNIYSVTVRLACFSDGGWFGPNVATPGSGQPLVNPTHLTAPMVQITTDGGVTWSITPSKSTYLAQLTGFRIGGSGQPNPNPRSFTINFPSPLTGINGIRVIGLNGGPADGNGFLGVFDFAVEASTLVDTDGDLMDDNWEVLNGMTVGVNDAALDADSDGLSNLLEFYNGTNPQDSDSDDDGLNDGPEVLTYNSHPLLTDSDADGLTDFFEVNTSLTNPILVDTDTDGLTDFFEVNTSLTNPNNYDSDGDGFPDNVELAKGTNPNLATSKPINVAFGGTAIAGVNTAIDSTLGTPYIQFGSTTVINDGNLATGVDTFGGPGVFSYAGISFRAPWPHDIIRIELTLQIFGDGGWFGPSSSSPGASNFLSPIYLTEPTVQITTDGTTWTTVAATSNYVATYDGYQLPPAGAQVAKTALFTLATPASGVRGIRLIGPEGGVASAGFLGFFEIGVKDSESLGDIDGDGLTNSDETNIYGTNPNVPDTDGDGLTDGQEVLTYLTNPLVVDTDGDQFSDGTEIVLGTNPNSAASKSDNQSRAIGATGVIGTNDALDGDNGTIVANAGSPANLIDGSTALVSRVDTYNGGGTDHFSYVGVKWATPRTTPITTIKFTMCTYFDGGWFGPNNFGGGAATLLTPAMLFEPTVQITTDGLNWTTISAVSDYLTVFNNHPLPTVAFGNPTQNTATVMLGQAQTGIMGIRLIGPEGGTASGGFLGGFEFQALTGGPVADSDGDGLLDSWELANFPSLATTTALADPDNDGIVNLVEYGLGLDPNVPNNGALATTIEGDLLTVTITKKPFVQYLVESSADLNPLTFSFLDTTILINDPTTLKVCDNYPIGIGIPKRFIRVRVSGP